MKTLLTDTNMKHLATVALMLNLGVAGVYAQETPVKMMFSGTAAPSTVDLKQPGTSTGEENFAGYGTLGIFTFRNISAETTSPQPSTTCAGPTKLYSLRLAGGGGVLQFLDGSQLTVSLMHGEDCIDLAAGQAHCTMTFQIMGGTGRFKNATGNLTLTETVVPVVFDAAKPNPNPVFFASTGDFTGTISGVAPR
jgi:hypothetical protein